MNDFAQWVDSRNKAWRNPTGFLAVTGMHWLNTEPQTFDDVTGTWWAQGHTVFADGLDGADLQSWTLEPRAEMMVPMAGGVVEIASRGGNMVLRPRHENSKMFELFDGVITYDYNPDFKVVAKLDANPRSVPISSVIGDLGISMDSAGVLEFEIDEQTCQLIAFTRPDPKTLYLIFRDQTNGKETYGTGRYTIANQLEDGTWEIDFNKSANFPCAYTDFATCPLAPAENSLKVEIAAGEKTPKIKSTVDGVIQKP